MSDRELLLGRETPPVEEYSPQLLFPIPRSTARQELSLDTGALPFYGEDIWHAYELSWLLPGGMPVARAGRFSIPADSPNLVESKSFKLYLNSLNFTEFSTDAAAIRTIEADVSAVAGSDVQLEVFALDAGELTGGALPGVCLDNFSPDDFQPAAPKADVLHVSGTGSTSYYSHLLRSLCPVTSQPDWASVAIQMEGAEVTPQSLLAYLLSYRQHQEFHEQCVERIFRDINDAARPDNLTVQAFYTRRGGMDINPWRSSKQGRAPRLRLDRQ